MPCFRFDDVIVDPEVFSVEKSGQVLTLEPKSIRLLLYLIRNRPRAVNKEELLHQIWDDAAVTDNALSRVVAQLRKGLGDDAKVARYVETVPTIGYRFIADVQELTGTVADAGPADSAAKYPRWLLAALALPVLAVVAAFGLWTGVRPNRQSSWSGTVLDGPVIASHPRISPDGQLLAFRAIVDGLSQVAVMKPESSSWTALTHDRNNGAVAAVAWARDGSKIYFDREGGPGRIYAIGPLGGDPRLVLENAWLPEPLPDGSLVAQRHSSEGREQLLRFWPDTGRVQLLPATAQYRDSPNVRAFPDGREIAIFGLPANAAGPPRLFALDLQTLQARNLVSNPQFSLREPLAISRDGRSAFIQRRREDTFETVAVPRSGGGQPQTLFAVPGIAAPISMDAGSDGAIYLDHSTFERSVLLIDPAGAIKGEIPIPQLAEGGGEQTVIALPDGAVVFDVQRRGRSELFIGRPGAEPQLLLNVPESAGLPGALLGDDKLAFILGAADQPHLAIASLRDGSILQRFPADARRITAVTAPANGRTIYYASNGTIWAQPVSGGEPRKVGEGYDIAIDPAGKFLYLIRAGADGHELFRMPAEGGVAVRLPLVPGFNLTPLPLSPCAVNAQGRILLPVNLLDQFFFRSGIFDPSHNTMLPLPAVPPRVVIASAGWTRDGGIAARITRWSSSLWRYRNSLKN